MTRMKQLAIAAMLAVATAACGGTPGPYPHIATLDPENAKADGARLIELPHGLNRLDQNAAVTRAVVLVHGWGSRGLEWVYPAVRLSDADAATYFFRWDWNGCPAPAAALLATSLKTAVQADPALRGVTVLGHSYGGLVVHEFLRVHADDLGQPVSAHTIASPLAGMDALTGRCGYTTADVLPRLSQWRTQHALDGAFRDLPVDPQDVGIAGSTVTRLPDTYRGRRLGHNWSISWVADELAQGRLGESVQFNEAR